jgi:hypothetical protein
MVKQGSEFSDYKKISAGVPQESILSPLLYSIYTADLPQNEHTKIATFADDTAILSSSEDPVEASNALQNHINV